MIDSTDWAILEALRHNSRMSWKEIGEKVHLTGQAVANRIARLEEIGVIEQYTVKINQAKLGHPLLLLITMYLKSNHHAPFLDFIQNDTRILEAYRISGDGCYSLKASLPSQEAVNELLENLLKYGNYKLNIAVGTIKD